MIKKLFLIIFYLQIVLICTAQSRLNGFVCDSVNRALPDANVLIFNNDSIIAGMATDAKGRFSLGLDTGKYTIHVSRLGYAEHIDTFVLPPTGLTLPSIVMKESDIELSEATIVGDRPMYESQLNKDVFNVSSRIKKSASDVYQILANVPSLIVDPVQRTIVQLAGAGNFIVMVNNIRRDRDYLLLLKPEDIDKVEINRYPGMRYRGTDAIINIVSKAPAVGQSIHVYGQINPLLKSGSTNGSYSYITEKIRASVSASTSFMDENKGEMSNVMDAIANGKTVHTEQNSNGKTPNRANDNGFSATVDYTPSANTFTSIDLRYNASRRNSYKPFIGFVSVDGQKDYDFESSQDTHYNSNTLSINPYFQTNLSKNSQISVEFRYRTEMPQTDNLFNELNSLQESSLISQIQKEHIQTTEGQVNIVHQLSKIQLEEGYRVYWQGNDMNVNTNESLNETTRRDLRNFAYVNVLGSIGKRLVYQAGLGFDATEVHINGELQDRNQQFTPNAMFRFNINRIQNITIDYMLIRQSPGYAWMLNPSPVYGIDSVHITMGNPELKPYYINRFALSYNYGGRKFSSYLSVRHQFADNYITQKRYLNNLGAFITTYVNTKQYSNTSILANFNFRLVNWWSFGVNTSMNYYVYKDDYRPLNKNFRNPSLSLNTSLNFSKFSLYVDYVPQFRKPTLTGYVRSPDFSSLFANYRLNKSWAIQLGIRYFTPYISKNETYAIDYSEIVRNHEKDRFMLFLLGFNYDFQKGIQKKTQQKRVKQYNDNVY
jgi:hypothetical protein